ncbi:MAG: carbohydrate ABC transporter permease [Spirochaetia bacterium]|nr:carbohydrate ABC transporter permease [Spirochaetia bacterium]
MVQNKKRRKTKRVFSIVLMVVIGVIMFFPLYWMLVSSFRTNDQIYSTTLNLLPTSLMVKNYADLLLTTKFVYWFTNSVLITLSTTILGLVLCTIAGFALARYRFRFRNAIFLLIFIMISIPRFTTIIPLFKVMSQLNFTDTYLSLILPFAVNPLALFLMKQYMESIPEDLLDSARIDGLNELQMVIRIVMPIIKPAIGAAGVNIVMMTWNDYLFPLVMMSSERKLVLTVGLASLKTLYVVEYGMIMAGSVISVLPLIIAFLIFQKQFVAGLIAGSVKG